MDEEFPRALWFEGSTQVSSLGTKWGGPKCRVWASHGVRMPQIWRVVLLGQARAPSLPRGLDMPRWEAFLLPEGQRARWEESPLLKAGGGI